MKTPIASVPFWYWSNWERIGTSAESNRTTVELAHPQMPILSRINYGHGPLQAAEVPLLEGQLEYSDRIEDCPWPTQDQMLIVSERVRNILEASAPGNCQFLPMKLWHNGNVCPLVFWTVYVDSIDCADPQSSGRSGGRICDPVIVEERVPASVQIFRVWDPDGSFDSRVLVRDSLRSALERKHVTGCVFYEPPKPSKALDLSKLLMGDVAAPLSEDQVAAAEEMLGCVLPGEYRDFIRQHSGGQLKPHVLLATNDNGNDFRLVKNVSLLPLVRSPGSSSPDVTSSQAEWKSVLPRECIVIGTSEDGAGIVLYVGGPRRGAVWVKHRNGDPADPNSGMLLCGRSFTAMMELLSLD